MDNSDEFYRYVGRKIRVLRTQQDLTQEDLARKIGMRRVSITNIEAGRQAPPLHTVYAIGTALGVNPKEFLPEPGEDLSDDSQIEEISILFSKLSETKKTEVLKLIGKPQGSRRK